MSLGKASISDCSAEGQDIYEGDIGQIRSANMLVGKVCVLRRSKQAGRGIYREQVQRARVEREGGGQGEDRIRHTPGDLTNPESWTDWISWAIGC
jgi:hypothetical protein